MNRPITFEQAKAMYVHRYTMEHVPEWAKEPCLDYTTNTFKHYAPAYATDKEWYDNTLFHGESVLADKNYCHSSNPKYPVGKWLLKPYNG